VLKTNYAGRYPESYDNAMDSSLVYCGSKSLTQATAIEGMDVGKMLLSPTRTFAPVLKRVFEVVRNDIHGIVHCSGGAQTKVLHFVDDIHIVKDNMFGIPPLFEMIQRESNTPMQEMYTVFNMGHRMELYLPDLKKAEEIINIAKEFNVDAKIIGYCEKADQKKLTIKTDRGDYFY
jgi:phosphoribosylformylglycinamidine cyclo-ligase